MIRLLAPLLLLISFLTTAESGEQHLAITNVTVIDATGAPARPAMTVLVAGDRIMEIKPSSGIQLPADTQLIDGTGRFLIPGLWDMHVHTLRAGLPEIYFPLFIANGVIGVRDMHGDLQILKGAREKIAAGALPPLQIVSAGFAVDDSQTALNEAIPLRSEPDAWSFARRFHDIGSDFIKVYTNLDRNVYLALAREASRLRLVFAGHVPVAVSAREASDAGQRSIEHLSGVLAACSREEGKLREEMKQLHDARLRSRISFARLLQATTQPRRLLETYDDKKAQDLFALFAKNRTWQTPTLTVLRVFATGERNTLSADPRQNYIPLPLRERWRRDDEWDTEVRSETDQQLADKRFQKELEIVQAMNRAGVPVLAGTDVGSPYIMPGFSLHDELALMVQAGLTPMEALQTATRNAAEYLGRDQESGTIEPGKRADLVLLKADPLKDIHNLAAVESVIVAGKVVRLSAQSPD